MNAEGAPGCRCCGCPGDDHGDGLVVAHSHVIMVCRVTRFSIAVDEHLGGKHRTEQPYALHMHSNLNAGRHLDHGGDGRILLDPYFASKDIREQEADRCPDLRKVALKVCAVVELGLETATFTFLGCSDFSCLNTGATE